MTLLRMPSPKYGETQYPLVISVAPVGALAVIGKPLLEAGTLDVAGVYECEIATDAMNTIEVELMPSAVTGTFAPALRAMRANRASYRAADEDTGGNFAGATTEVLTLTDLHGKQVCKVVFTIPSGGSIAFAAGTNPASPTAIAESNGL